jgi:Holliday junction resolvase RusA-like endonuclease
MDRIIFEVEGEPASKANSRRIVRIGNRIASIKSAKALSYADAFRAQAPKVQPIEGPVCVTLHIFYASRRPDLDESLILDLLQGIAYDNDRQVREKHIYWGLDPERPRCHIEIEARPGCDPDGGGGRRPRKGKA